MDSLLSVANSSSGKNLIKVATSKDAKATAKSMLEAKREIWKDAPLQLVRDLREAKRDYEKLKEALSGNVKKKWGKKEIRLPESKTYVKYTRQYKSRAIVNFEQGEISIETLEENADASLKNAIISTLLTPEDPASVDVFSDSAVKTDSKSAPFLLGLVLNDAGQEIATPDAAASFADKILPTARMRTIQTENGDKSVRFVSFAMVANFEDKKAQKYLQHVRKYAKQYNVSPSLVLSVLTFDQLDKVSVRTSRDYCVISAYNTGLSNVMRAFTDAKGKQRFEEGFQRINNLSQAQVFQTLREKIPYEETRGYLPTVNTNRKLYYSIDKTLASGDNNTPPIP